MTDALTQETLKLAEEVAKEAREEFHEEVDALPETMRGKHRPRRTGNVTIFMDSVSGERYQKIEVVLDALEKAIENARALEDEDGLAQLLEQQALVSAKSEELKTALLADAYSFDLRALPPVIMKGLRRTTRDVIGALGKGLTEEEEERYNEEFIIQMLLAQTVKFVDHGESEESRPINDTLLREIRDYGDDFQWLRLVNLANDLQFRSTISESVTGSADFSPRI